MQHRFNEGKYYERMLEGEFTAVVVDKSIPKADVRAKYGEDTISLGIEYRDANNDTVVRVHQYESPDGKILASGKPDPKRLWENGIAYRIIKKKNFPLESQR